MGFTKAPLSGRQHRGERGTGEPILRACHAVSSSQQTQQQREKKTLCLGPVCCVDSMHGGPQMPSKCTVGFGFFWWEVGRVFIFCDH